MLPGCCFAVEQDSPGSVNLRYPNGYSGLSWA